MDAPMPTAARSSGESRPDMTVSITPLIMTASWPMSTGQPSFRMSRAMERNINFYFSGSSRRAVVMPIGFPIQAKTPGVRAAGAARIRTASYLEFVHRLHRPVVGRRHVAMVNLRNGGRNCARVPVGDDEVDRLGDRLGAGLDVRRRV